MRDVYLVGYGEVFEMVLVYSGDMEHTKNGFRLNLYDVNSGKLIPMYYENGELTLKEERYPVDYIDTVSFREEPINRFLKPFMDSDKWIRKMNFSDYKESYHQKGRTIR